MKGHKVLVTVRIETMSVDSVQSKLYEVVEQYSKENTSGVLRSEDGDEAKWDTEITPVEF